MYTIKAFVGDTEYLIHHPKIKALTVGDPYFEVGDNVNGQAEFTVYPTHPYYEYVKKLTTDIVFYNDGVEEFAGRILYDDEDSKGAKKVFVEGELAYFCDSVQRPKVYHNYTVAAYLGDLIELHNGQVEERKQFQLGHVTVVDSNDSLYRYSNWETTRECLSDKLVDRLGGHLVIRKENGIRYLDYLSDDDFYTQSTQTIQFGKNLLDFARNIDASDIATCIIPLGATLDEEDQDESLEAISEQRLTIADINGGVDYVTDDNAVANYGKIFKTVTWDDVTVATNLKTKGEEYLASVQYENMVLELTAIDLSLTDDTIEQLNIGHKVRCISEPHGLDSWFPLSEKKVYITNFAKNTLTLGTESSTSTYTSSNQQTSATMEETIENLPSKREILQLAKQDAQDLINAQVASGYAIHEPNEFIVADNIDYKNQAENLWRWGLGGLAHYSEGYDGPVDGIAITMDGKINGEMLMVGSVYAESIDIGYRTSVESTITEAETAAKNYADDTVKAAQEAIETSITNLENRISLSVSSVKEIVLKKNYVTSGEQETLDADAFTKSGSYATVAEAEFLNMNCLKLTFTSTGVVYLNQDLGTLPAGKYKIAVEAAFETTALRPTYIAYGFSNNRTTAYFSNYTANEFHTFSKEVEITETSKTVSVGIYGTAGKVCYITNIRCLRDMQELLDDLETSFTVSIGEVSATVSNIYENSQHDYVSNGDFSNTDDKFTGWYRPSSTYVTQTTLDSQSCAKITDTSATRYYVRRTINNQKAGPFRVRFKAACASGYESTARIRVYFNGQSKYTTAGELTTEFQTFTFDFDSIAAGTIYCYFYNYTLSSTIYITDIEILGYMSAYSESQFSVLQDSISAEVTRATGAEDDLSASLKLTAEEFEVEIEDVKDNARTLFAADATSVTISSGTITFNSGTFVVNSTYFKVTSTGVITATSGKIGGFTIASSSLYNGKSSLSSTTSGIYISTSGISVGSGSAYTALASGYLYGGGTANNINGYVGFNNYWSSSGVYGTRLAGRGCIALLTSGPFGIGSYYSFGSSATITTGQSGSIRVTHDLSITAQSGGGVSWSYSHSTITFTKGLMTTAL